jgi:alpha-beta hydrolase superfamily lysophospholipase
MTLPDQYSQHGHSARQRARAERAFRVPSLVPASEHFRRYGAYDVHLDLHEPAGEAQGHALLIHGAGANGRLLAPFAAPLLARGLRVLAPDLPGYGITRGDSSRTRYHEWIEILTEIARELLAHGPLVLFGLSVGGLTALRVAQKVPEIRAVVATTLIELGDPAVFDRVARSRALGMIARWTFHHLPWLSDRLALPLSWLAPLERMTSDRELGALLRSDALLGARRVPLRFMRSLHEYRPERTDYDLPCPLLLVHPGADRWTPLALSLRVFDTMRSEKELVVLSGGAHAPLESPAFAELCAAVEGFLAKS